MKYITKFFSLLFANLKFAELKVNYLRDVENAKAERKAARTARKAR